MNEDVLYTLAEVAVTLAGFSGLVVVFRLPGTRSWSPTELGVLWFLIGNSLIVLFLSLIPIPLALAQCSQDGIWGFCNGLLAVWFFAGNVIGIRARRRDPTRVSVPIITPALWFTLVVAFAMGTALLLSAFNVLLPRSQSLYVLGLIVLLGFAAVQFLFFIGRMSQGTSE